MRNTPDEIDLQLLHLLQIVPRISWTSAAEILMISANALATRWSRLSESGLAWLSVYPSTVGTDHVTAVVDVDAAPRQCASLAAALCGDSRVVSVEECAGGRDLLLTVMVRDLRALATFVVDDLGRMEGVAGTRTSVVTAVHTEGSAWRLDALDPAQQRQARAAREVRQRRTSSLVPSEHWPLIEAVTRDARSPVADLARSCGQNAATTRRHLAQLLDSEALTIRCDMAPSITGWGVMCTWLARMPWAEQARTVAVLSRLPQVRLCMSLTGPANLGFTVLSRNVSGIADMERLLGERLPHLQSVESMLHLRTHKRMGWLTGPDGRCTGEVVAPEVFAPAPA